MKFIIAAIIFTILSQSVFSQSATDGSESKLRTKCTYFADKLILNCTGPSGRVECETADQLPVKAKIIGLGFPKDKDVAGMIKFKLHPLKSDNTAWLNNNIMVNGKMVEMSIFQSPKIQDGGFRLKDAGCFDRLTALFRSSVANLIVPASNDVKPGPVDQSRPKIELFGEIFWFERSMAKSQEASSSVMGRTQGAKSTVVLPKKETKIMSKREGSVQMEKEVPVERKMTQEERKLESTETEKTVKREGSVQMEKEVPVERKMTAETTIKREGSVQIEKEVPVERKMTTETKREGSVKMEKEVPVERKMTPEERKMKPQ